MNGLLGKKIGMTQIYADNGDCVPVTVVQVEKCVPVLQKSIDIDGYQSVLVAYGDRKEKHTNKPMQGVYKKLNTSPSKLLTEFRNQEVSEDEIGRPLKVDMFEEGDLVDVLGVSKGRGFAGVVKRFGYRGQPASRGTHESFRGAGSIGMCTYPGRTFKGKGMPGRMGGKKVHVKNLRVVRVDAGNNVLLLRGAIPGANGGLVRILGNRPAAK